MEINRIYIAGALNAMAVEYIKNLHKMFSLANMIREAGFSVYIPGLDLLMGIQFGNWEYEDYFQNSQPWLDASDSVYVVPGWEKSKGTNNEIKRAKEKGIPVFYNVSDLMHWKNGVKELK